MSWLAETHRDNKGKASWTRQASSLTLIVLCAALLTGHAEWGSQYVMALAIVFGLKGGQKYVEERMGAK